MNRTLLTAALLLGSACHPADGIDGLWLLSFAEPETELGDSTCDENWRDADCPSTDSGWSTSDWITESDAVMSPALQFAELITSTDGTAVLVVDDAIYPGTRDKEGWTFTWESYDRSARSENHVSGYGFGQTTDVTVTTTFDLTLDGKTATGRKSVSTDTSLQWSESDSWDSEEVGKYAGEIPSYTYLIGEYTENIGESAECRAGVCELAITGASRTVWGLSGQWTGYDAGAGFDGVQSANQPYGADGF